MIQSTPEAIADLKRRLDDRGEAFRELDAALRRDVDEIVGMAANGASPVPQAAWQAVRDGAAPPELPDLIRRRGCVVLRGVFPRAQAEAWNAELIAYLESNDADGVSRARRPDRWGTAAPQMYSVYWSPPQVQARQSAELAEVRGWLNRLWRWQGHFEPDAHCTYADRMRRRTPGDSTLALSPHIHGGAAGRWLGLGHRPYMSVFAGDPLADFDPFDAASRPDAADETDSNSCAVFRSWQGWTALTAQGPGDGTLQVVPIARAIAWVLLRPFCPDVPVASLCGCEASRSLGIRPDWHAPLLRALVPIPHVEPGDTVWWHPDLIHAVEPVHTGRTPSNVMYIPASPDCARNRAFLPRQLAAFATGQSPPDFPPDHLETGFAGRAGPEMLNALGRRQMGLA
jgi:hypothetical protein